MAITIFQVEDKVEKSWYFERSFSLAEINMSIVLGMLFFILSNTKINFID